MDKYIKVKKAMAICITIALCFQRLSMAAGSIFWGISIACFLFLLYKSYQAGDLQERAQAFSKYYKVIAFMLICFIPSVVFSMDVKTSVKAFGEMWLYRLMPFFMVTLFLQDKKWLQRIICAFIVATCLDCLVAAYQVYGMHEWRGWGFGGHSLNLASLLCIMTPMYAVILFDDEFSPKLKKLCQIALVCSLIGLIAGKSRGAWLTLAIILPLVSYRYVLKSKKALAICLVIVLAIGAGFATNKQYKKRLLSIGNTTTNVSNADRIRVWQSCWHMIGDYPVTGVGLGKFKEAYTKGGYRLKSTVQDLPHSHNNYLQLWTEGGTIGFIGFMAMSLFILLSNFKLWWQTKSPYYLMLWGPWLGFMIFGMFDLIIDHSAITKAWWFLLGAWLVMAREKDSSSKSVEG
ncbi:MAG: O-antigen ligase family protein [Phascolarctobacterium sp.]|nr:O-antigen ligase family protein [Phascolarctobacterium sp.]